MKIHWASLRAFSVLNCLKASSANETTKLISRDALQFPCSSWGIRYALVNNRHLLALFYLVMAFYVGFWARTQFIFFIFYLKRRFAFCYFFSPFPSSREASSCNGFYTLDLSWHCKQRIISQLTGKISLSNVFFTLEQRCHLCHCCGVHKAQTLGRLNA